MLTTVPFATSAPASCDCHTTEPASAELSTWSTEPIFKPFASSAARALSSVMPSRPGTATFSLSSFCLPLLI